jgi:hypothetical protein
LYLPEQVAEIHEVLTAADRAASITRNLATIVAPRPEPARPPSFA